MLLKNYFIKPHFRQSAYKYLGSNRIVTKTWEIQSSKKFKKYCNKRNDNETV